MIGYQYNADGNRVGKGSVTSIATCDITQNGYQPMTDFVLDQSGGQMTEMAISTTGSGTTSSWVHSNVTAGGALLATFDNNGYGLHFYLNDALGSRRVQTNPYGIPEQICQSLPFGDQLYCTGGSLTSPTEHHFTGKERDSESGLDYFGARYMSSSMGRFMSPDPVGGSLSNPQTLNRYAYVVNNPLRNTDPTGLDCVYKGDSAANSTVVRGDCLSDDDDGVFVDAHVDSLFDKGNDIWAKVSAYTDQNNPYGGTGTPSTDPDDARIMQLAQGINQYAGALNNPSTYVAWYGASLVGDLAPGNRLS
jgi:RHS repeat-associated protein